MRNHHFQWENSVQIAIFNSTLLNYRRVPFFMDFHPHVDERCHRCHLRGPPSPRGPFRLPAPQDSPQAGADSFSWSQLERTRFPQRCCGNNQKWLSNDQSFFGVSHVSIHYLSWKQSDLGVIVCNIGPTNELSLDPGRKHTSDLAVLTPALRPIATCWTVLAPAYLANIANSIVCVWDQVFVCNITKYLQKKHATEDVLWLRVIR